jgi:SAM-dependent methyltransferase
VKNDHSADWEELARREPYFALLGDDGAPEVGGNTRPTAGFFDAGEADIDVLLAAITSLLGRAPALTRVLDFGCGAGRLTLPLARRAHSVVACDVAPTILDHAKQNAERAGLHNVSFIGNDALARSGQFDFICSLLVFEHIPSETGYEILRILMTLLAPGAVAAIHIPLRRPTDTLRRLVRFRSLPENRTRGIIRQVQRRAPDAMERSEYEERSVLRCVKAGGARLVARLPIHHHETTGAVIIIEKTLRTNV